MSAGVRPPSGLAASCVLHNKLDRASCRQGSNAGGGDCTTRFENAHRTVLRQVFYPHHPWSGRQVCVHATIDKSDDVFFRCTLEGSEADRWLEIPAWMFDRAGCAQQATVTAEPFVSLDALAALSTLLDLALKDRTPSSNAQLSGASRASQEQNRGEAHVTQDGDIKGRRPAQPATVADGAVRERSARNRRADMAGASGGSAGDADQPHGAVDPRSRGKDHDAAHKGGRP